MPAWGGSHDDETIWSMVAFLQKLPDMTPSQYKEVVDKAPPDDDMATPPEGGHSHNHAGHNHAEPSSASDPPGDAKPSTDHDHSHTHSGEEHGGQQPKPSPTDGSDPSK
jgi:hypothetical protein